MMPRLQGNGKQKILVWDLPTRIFHWLLVASFIVAYATSESEKLRDWHMVSGYLLAGLILFRIMWGFVGTKYARFLEFIRSPAAVLDYVNGLFSKEPKHYIGHNPAGAVAIVLLLTCGLGMGMTGWMLFNDLGGSFVEQGHEALASIMVTIVIIHVCGVLLSSILHNENLIRAMLSGYKFGDKSLGIKRQHCFLGVLLFIGFIYAGYSLRSGNLPFLMP